MAKRDISRAVELGLVARERRVWLATPDADPMLRCAARDGVVLACVTQARRLGLWVEADAGVHVACDPKSAGGKPTCRPYERALAVWDSALHKGLIDLPSLRRLDLRGTSRKLALEASPFRNSGLESFVPARLRWLRLPIRSQIWLYGAPVDFLIGDRLVLQIDGGHHVGAQRTRDIEHDARLMLAGAGGPPAAEARSGAAAVRGGGTASPGGRGRRRGAACRRRGSA